jgi:glycosyltransferase involved in cell wall biosynthesis
MTNLRLLTFTTSHEEGGAEVHLRSTLEAARARGYDVTVALPWYASTARLRDDLRTNGCEVRALSIGRVRRSKAGVYLTIAADFLRALWMIVQVRPRSVLLSLPSPEATPGAMVACALIGVPTTAVFLLVRADLRTSPRRRALYRFASRRSTWICLSEHNRRTLASAFGISPQRIAIVRNGMNLRRVESERRHGIREKLGLSTTDTMVLTTARLSDQKEHRVIVEALPQLIGLDGGLVFVWVGDGPLKEKLEADLAATGLETHVLLLGKRDDTPELLLASDLFLMPSRDEGGAPPLALVEAMQAGVPAIVSDTGALAESIQDRSNGLVFSRGEADDLARVMGWAVNHRQELEEMATRGRDQAMREFTVERMTDRLLSYIGEPRSPEACDPP